MAQGGADAHEDEAEQVLPAPLLRVCQLRVVRRQADAPDGIDRADFDEDVLFGRE